MSAVQPLLRLDFPIDYQMDEVHRGGLFALFAKTESTATLTNTKNWGGLIGAVLVVGFVGMYLSVCGLEVCVSDVEYFLVVASGR